MPHNSDYQTPLSSSRQLWQLLSPDRAFYRIAIVYSLAISLLTLAVPIAVQTLINTVANVGSLRAIVMLASLLGVVLLLSGLLSALRTQVMEFFERRLYARLTAEVSLRTIYARHEYFEGRRNTDITNRYFDIAILQKNVPLLLVDGFAMVLQMLVGFSLVSFYHPALMLFNLAVVISALLFWKFWGRAAVRTAVDLSHAKYATAKWLDSLAYANEFFKSTRHIDYAVARSDRLIGDYIGHRQQHFRYSFAQTVAFLVLYAIASAALLGLGGWLVLKGQLSLGQLVAAELILSAILFGLSRFASYLSLYYELCGAADELGQVVNVPQEDCTSREPLHPGGSELQMVAVELFEQTIEYRFDFTITDGAKVLVAAEDHDVQRAFLYLLKRHLQPQRGWVHLAGCDLQDYDVYQLRQQVVVIDREPIVECSVADYLEMACPGVGRTEMQRVLVSVGLFSRLQDLPKGVNTLLSPMGAPLSTMGFLRLKLAAALLAKPKMLVLTEFFDLQPRQALQPLLDYLGSLPLSVIFFSHNPHRAFDQRLVLQRQRQWFETGEESK